MGLSGPEVDQVGVAARPPVGAQRRGEVIDLRIGRRRLGGVLAMPAVDDPARGAPAERAREHGASFRRGGRPLRRRRRRLARAEKGGADLRRARARDEHRAERGAGHDRAGGDQGQRDAGADELQGREQRELGLLVVVGEHAAVTARLDALDDERVGTRGRRGGGLGGRGHGQPHLGAACAQIVDHGLGRQPKGERHDRRGGVAQDVDLLGEGVVVKARSAEGHPGPLRLGAPTAARRQRRARGRRPGRPPRTH